MTAALNRPIAIEYRVSGALDGVTPAPALAMPPDFAAPLSDDNYLIQEVDNLGLVDLSKGDGAAYAGRIVKFIEIVGPNVPSSADNVGVAIEGVNQRTELSIPAAANGIYSRNCIFVPQTGQLRLNGMAAGADPVIVRVKIWQLKRVDQLAEIFESCCCKGRCVDDADEPCFVQAIYAAAAAARTVTVANPVSGARGASITLTMTGTGFIATDNWVIRQVGTASPGDFGYLRTPVSKIEIDSVTLVNPTTVELRFELALDQPLGDYDILVSPELGHQAHAAQLTGGFEVTT